MGDTSLYRVGCRFATASVVIIFFERARRASNAAYVDTNNEVRVNIACGSH